MKTSKKVLSIILAIMMILSIIPLTASAATYSGTCGDNLTWELTIDGTLSIFGIGNMYDYTSTTQPWNSCKSEIKSIIINEGVTSIGNYAFYSCSNLTSVTIPNSVTSIGNSAFSGCSSIMQVHIPNITSWCNIDFSSTSSNPLFCKNAYLYVDNNKITDLVIPNGTNSIKDYTFYNYVGLTSITIPNNVTSIGSSAFRNCSGLTSITIPNSVTSIGNSAFYGCSGLTSVSIEATTPPTITSSTFTNVSKTIPVTIPCGSLSAYQSASYWSEFTNIIEFVPEVTAP